MRAMETCVSEPESFEAFWTVKDNEGVTHRAIRQHAGTMLWVVTLCDWWRTHNVYGEKAPIRVEEVPTCIKCVMIEFDKLAYCRHCGVSPKEHRDAQTHLFEAGP